MICNDRELCFQVCGTRVGGVWLGGCEGTGEGGLPPTQPCHPGWVRHRLQSFRAFSKKKQTPLVFHVLSSLHSLPFHTGLRIQKSIGLRMHISTHLYIYCMPQQIIIYTYMYKYRQRYKCVQPATETWSSSHSAVYSSQCFRVTLSFESQLRQFVSIPFKNLHCQRHSVEKPCKLQTHLNTKELKT